MSQIYKADGAAQRYDSARALPDETSALWMKTLASALPPDFAPSRILDLGAGTGRFAPLLRKTFGGTVHAVEPVETMFEVGLSRMFEGVEWHRGTAESIPLESDSVEMVWMSQVFHHLDDPGTAVQEIRRVLRSGGYVAIRNGTKENNAEIEWIRCFPEAARIDDGRLPSHQDVIDAFSKHSFNAIVTQTVYQYFAASYSEYYDKISQRGLSSLIAISDEAFAAGLRRLKDWIEKQFPSKPVYEPVDLFVFQVDKAGESPTTESNATSG